MEYFNPYKFFCILCVLHVFGGVFCTDSIYEQISPYVQDSEIVDPSSLYYDRQSQTVKAPRYHQNGYSKENEIAPRNVDDSQSYQLPHCRDRSYEVFARRVINVLISKANLKVTDGMAIGQLDIEATVEELEVLRGFGEGRISIRQVDRIISDAIRASQTSLFDDALDYTDRLTIYIYQHRIIFASMLLTVFVIIIAVKVRWTRMRIIFLLFDIIVIISFVLTWWELLQETEIKLTAQQRIYSTMPDECRQDRLGFFRSVWLFLGIGRGDCLKYFEAVMADPVLRVTPLHAFSHMSTKLLFHPLSAAGHYLSDFIEGITRPLPFPFNHVAKLLLVLFMPCLMGGILFVSIGGSVGVRLGPFLHVYLHGRQSTPPTDSLANSDRQAIEVIRSEISAATAETRSASHVKKDSSKAIKATQSEESKVEKSNKQEQDSDTNSDEYPEEKEYEKISKKKIEDEINQSSDNKTVKIEDIQKEKEQNTSESISKDKRSLEIGSGDS